MGLSGPNDSVCCSFGQCTDASICDGNKYEDDYCDRNNECQKGLYCENDKCVREEDNKQNPWGIVILISLIVFVLSHLLNICLTKMSEQDDTNLEYNRVGRNGRV